MHFTQNTSSFWKSYQSRCSSSGACHGNLLSTSRPLQCFCRLASSSGGYLAPSLGGRNKFSRTKISIFTAKMSDDLFLVIDQVFRIFPFFSQIVRIFTMFNVVYDPFLTRTITISEKNSFMTPFLLCSYFRAHPTTLLLKIFGGRMHGPSPHLKFFLGAVPQSSLGLRPWPVVYLYMCLWICQYAHLYVCQSISKSVCHWSCE